MFPYISITADIKAKANTDPPELEYSGLFFDYFIILYIINILTAVIKPIIIHY